MDKTPRESAQKPLVSAVWGSRFVDLNSQRRNDEPARPFFDSFFGNSFSWNALSGHATAAPPERAQRDPQGIRGDCKEMRRGAVNDS